MSEKVYVNEYLLCLSVLKCCIPLHAERDSHREVLGSSLVGLYGSGVVVERFPFGRITVPENMSFQLTLIFCD
jgi:hypothetical protein